MAPMGRNFLWYAVSRLEVPTRDVCPLHTFLAPQQDAHNTAYAAHEMSLLTGQLPCPWLDHNDHTQHQFYIHKYRIQNKHRKEDDIVEDVE